ncbi:hypothetical protein HMPREF1986_02563 [Oribacterium sp. oral taxon 078 str. F0263]|nr:hypothetical protein HMPREF1986_02563 [Oribacterium sp. oral taxon 078 str. F0263]
MNLSHSSQSDLDCHFFSPFPFLWISVIFKLRRCAGESSASGRIPGRME